MKLRLHAALLWCLVFSIPTFGQKYINLNDGFSDTYFYKIDAKQALEIYANPLQSPDSTIFSKPFYVQDDSDTLPLPYGNYLSISFAGNRLVYKYYPVTSWRIYRITNKRDLIVQFIDLHTNKPIKLDAVLLGKKTLNYDDATKSYTIFNNKKTGILSVTDKGETYYLSVKDNNYHYTQNYNSVMNRLFRKRPLYDAALIYRIFNRGLFDAYTTITGTDYDNVLRETKSEIMSIGRMFSSKKTSEYYTPYFYFSKPKYKEGDTIKFKAYFLKRNTQQWCDKPLSVFLRKGSRDRYRYNDKPIFLGKAIPKRKAAGYDYQFTMADSLHLDLDMDYSIDMKDVDSNLVGEGTFRYEDYELKKAIFKINLADGNKHFKGIPFGITFTAKDENGLPMPDTRAAITVFSGHLSNIAPNELFVPDTLWNYTTNIKNGEDKIIIPDSIFPEADVAYSVEAVLQNSENEREDLDKDINFYLQAKNIKLASFKDSISVKQIIPDDKWIHLYAQDNFKNNILDTLLRAPCTIPLNTNAQTYYAETDRDYEYDEDIEEELTMSEEYAAIAVNARRTIDSIFFTLDNERKLPMVYHLFKDSKELKRGTNQDFPFAISANENSDVYIRSEYIWAGQTNEDKFRVIIPKNRITLKVDQPSVITPGKETDINITATDYKNNPLKDVNLLAYSYTQKFGDASLPYMPSLGYRSKSYPADYSFELEERNAEKRDTLNFSFWNARMLLDTNWYYRFTYPGHYKLQYTHIAVDDSITQVAPFVMDHGAPQAIQYVFIDNVPVYFGFTSKRMPYSFQVDTNYHQMVIRTSKKLLVIDSVKVQPYVKSLFSIDQNDPYISVHADPYPDTFTNDEIRNLQSYVMGINMPVDRRKYAYLRLSTDSEKCIDISGFNSGRQETFFTVGPIAWRYWDFVFYKQYTRPFNYEPAYTYTFEQELIKMKSNNRQDLLPFRLPDNVPNINDVVLSPKQLFQKLEDNIYDERRRKSLDFIPTQINGYENLTLEYGDKYNHFNAVNVILLKPGDLKHINIYSGDTRSFYHLPPGKYQMLFVNENKLYLKTGNIEIKANGQNFYRLHDADTLSIDSVYALNRFLDSLYLPATKASQATINKLLNDYIGKFNVGGRYTYFGTVLDEHNETLPGVSIKLIGTGIRTLSDVEGNFQLEIPTGIEPLLEISTIGYNVKTVQAVSGLVINLMPIENALNEVTITMPYGPSINKEKYVGAADVITSKKIENTPVGDITRAIEGAAAGVQVTNGTGAPGSGADIQIRGRGSLSAASMPLIVINGAPYEGDLASIDPTIVASMNILKDVMATSLYGSRGANGVILITTKQGVALPENIKLGLKEPLPPMSPDMLVSGMRHNFKDDAYWQPDLVTDENGKASFKVTFPDDITNWQTIVIGVDDKLHTGQASGNIKSYKPIAASLYLPHFLLDGDTAILVGKSVNYIPDTIPVTTTFYQDDSLKMEHKLKLGAYYSDTLLATAHGSDSVKLKYLLTKEDGYFDGEERTIPLERIGVKVAEGGFQALDMKDTSFTIYPTKRSDTLHIAATASLVDVVLDEIEVVRDYGYLCNEQMASKILALLSKQKMYALLHKDFSQKDKDYINQLLGKISKNQNNNHLWGWWENGGTVNWISNHVLHAIMESKAQGYSCNIDLKPITDAYIFDLERDTVYTNIPMLQTLAESGLTLNFEKYISRLEHNKKLPFNDYLDLVLLRQKLHLPYKLDRLNNLKEEDIFGNIYWKDTAQFVYSNEMLTTVKALKIIQNDSGNSIHKNKIINWLLQQRGSHGWRNTYESVQIIESIAPYIPLSDTAALKPVLKLNGGMQDEIKVFPYQKAILLSTPLVIHKTGVAPVYFTWYYNKWDTSNTNLGKSFKIKSHFEAKQKATDHLPAGEPVTLKVNVQVDKSAEYVMLEIPIPAGCSYQSKPQPYYNHEIHREYFENKVSIFCDALPKGNYTFDVELLPRYQGKYTLNPAKAELMYFPVFYGREMIKKVEIKP